MAQLLVIGDTHCHFDLIEAIAARELATDADTTGILHVGDIGLYDSRSLARMPARERGLIEKHGNPIHLAFGYVEGSAPLPLPLVGIPGNHEDFELVARLEAGSLVLPGLHLLGPGVGRELSLGDRVVRVMGLGRIAPGVPGSKHSRRAKYFQPEDLELATEHGVAWGPQILLLHDPPLLQVVGQRGTFGSPALSALIERVRPAVVLAGHMHFEYQAEITGVPVYGVGYGAKGRYAVLDEDLRLHFRDLAGRPAAPRGVAAPSLPLPDDLAEQRRGDQRRREKARLQRRPLPITGRQLMERFALGRVRRRDRRSVDHILAQLRALLLERGDLSEAEAWEAVEPWVRELFPQCGQPHDSQGEEGEGRREGETGQAESLR
ncbi:MAG: metallophosphoesterase [Pseudomonadota bacterium]